MEHRYIGNIFPSKTKIIATVGPAIASEDKLREIIFKGIDICRLNFSHGDLEGHLKVIQMIRKINSDADTHIAILGDLQGPKIRLGIMEEEGAAIFEGEFLTITNKEIKGNSSTIFISYQDLPKDVKTGDVILIDDGKIKLEVVATDLESEIKTKVIYGGKLYSKKGVNLPDTKISIPSLTGKDLKDVEFMLEHNIDWIALSFVRWASDIKTLKKIIQDRKMKTLVMAKIEKPEALDDLDSIIEEADAVMVARGDLGVEVSFDRVPYIQKQIVQKCIRKARPVVIATQMLESMILNFRPTRAEANDVANAVFDCADTVMLSGETSIGKYPVESVGSMQNIIEYAEGTEFVLRHDEIPELSSVSRIHDSVCYNACRMSDQSEARAIIVFTSMPQTVFHIACHRPKAPVFIFTPDKQLICQLSVVWGVESFYIDADMDIDHALSYSLEILRKAKFINQNDLIVYVSSIPLFGSEAVNSIRLGHA